jgi:hypothetical protein
MNIDNKKSLYRKCMGSIVILALLGTCPVQAEMNKELTQKESNNIKAPSEDVIQQLTDPDVAADKKRQILYRIKSRESQILQNKRQAYLKEMQVKITERFKPKYDSIKSLDERKQVDQAYYQARARFFEAFNQKSKELFEQLDEVMSQVIKTTYESGTVDLGKFKLLNEFSESHQFNLAEEILKLIFPELEGNTHEEQVVDDNAEDCSEDECVDNESSEEDTLTDIYSDDESDGDDYTDDTDLDSEEDTIQDENETIEDTRLSEQFTSQESKAFITAIAECKVFEESFRHPLTGELLKRYIHGVKNNRCFYEEQMPNNGLMTCHYSLSRLPDIAWFYAHPEAFENMKVNSFTQFVDGQPVTKNTYTVDGKEISHPLNEALEQKECKISGY